MSVQTRWPATILTLTLVVLVAGGALLSRVGLIAAQQDASPVQVVDFAFEPGMLTVPAGATVSWTNAGSRTHTVTADDGSFDSGRLDPGEQFSQTFDQRGTFTYHCGFHPEMQGSIVVTEPQEQPAATDEATPAADEPASTASAPVSGAAGPARNLEPTEPSRLAHIHAGTCDEL